MKADLAGVTQLTTPPRASHSASDWLLPAALVVGAIVWLLVCYWDTARSIVVIWVRSETFAHGFLIVPISAWIVWQERSAIAALAARPNFLVLPLLALVGFGWLLGHLAGAGVVQQFSLVLMIQVLVWAILGNQVTWALWFPLFFLLFAVPFGEFLEPPLMVYTADFAAFAVRLSGIPVYREGQFLTLPSGSWSVVEACSGLRYLIASMTVGFLYAYLTYRSFMRRAIFVVLSVIVPIVANWLRAYMILMIGHLSGMKYAVGVDHLIYGWVFFGAVMMILFWMGARWREDFVESPAATVANAPVPPVKPPPGRLLSATLAAAAIAAAWPLLAARLDAAATHQAPDLQTPSAAQGWQPVAARLTDWAPRFANPRAQINQTYAKDAMRAGVFLGYYQNQNQQSQLISSQNRLVTSDDAWATTAERRRSVTFNGEEIPLIETELRGRSGRLLVWHWYRVDGQYTVSQYWAKLLQAKSMLSGRGDDGAVVIIYTNLESDRDTAVARLEAFTTAMRPAIDGTLDHAHAR